MFYFNMEPRLKWNKIILAAKIILWVPSVHYKCQHIFYKNYSGATRGHMVD